MGFLPQALANYMTLLGWTPPDSTEEIFTLTQAAEQFNLERVNKAGAKFDWDKLDWINSQYLHKMSGEELVDLLVPYWQQAGYPVDVDGDRPWLEQMATLIGPSLTRLSDGVKESVLLFGDRVDYSEEAIAQMRQEGVKEVLQAVLEKIAESSQLTEDEAKDTLKQVTKTFKVKKGLVMRSLRAGLMGELHGPDLIQSWLLLNQKGWDKSRLSHGLDLL